MVKKRYRIRRKILFIRVAFWIFILLLNVSSNLYTQKKYIDFEHITFKHGLSQSCIYCIFQDSKGFLWFGTDDGLNKYDGYKFTVFRPAPEPEKTSSLSGYTVETIIEDRSGFLWIGTFGGGLDKYDRKRETFTNYQTDFGNSRSLSDNKIYKIIEDQAGILWIGTFGGGLNKFDPEAETFTHYKNDPGNPNSLSSDRVFTIHEDKREEGVLWIGTSGGGLNKFDTKTKTFTRYLADPANPDRLSDNDVYTIYEDKDGLMWIGTLGGGLHVFNPVTGTFTCYKSNPKNPKSLSDNDVRKIYRDKTGLLWIGTAGGLNTYDPVNEEFTRYRADPLDPNSLSVDSILSIYEDRSGVLWIGTTLGGINKFNREKEKFNHFFNIPNDPKSLSNNKTMAIYEDRSGVVWIGTFGGLNKFDRNKETFSCYRNNAHDPSSLSDNRVMAIHEDRAGILWIGTLDGLNQFDRNKGKFSRFMNDPKDSSSLSDNIIMSICEDRWGFLWIGTSVGLNKLDGEREKFTCYQNHPDEPDSISGNMIYSIFEDHSGVLWIGTTNGLNKYDREKEIFAHYLSKQSKQGDSKIISPKRINVIFEDSTGTLWVGTYGSLERYDRKEDRFTSYRMRDGLPNDIIYGILEDDHGNLWISTNNGLSKFNPGTGEFKNYDTSDGLQSNEFTSGACRKSSSGELFFGGINGFNFFYPDQIKNNPHRPPIVITDFQVLNKPVEIGEDSPLKQAITETEEIVLSYWHNVFFFEFAALDYTAPEKNQYAYKMEGFDKDWISIDTGRRTFPYMNMSPGTYTFRVKGSNNHGVWNEKGASIRIIITPPFWQTWWFRILMGLFLIFCIIGGYKWRTRLLRNKLEEQERVQRILKQSRDEMEKSRNLAEFRNAENEKLIAAISSIFITVGADGKIFQWNHASETFFGIPADDVKGQLLVDLLKDYMSAEKLDEIIQMGLHSDRSSNNIEIPVHFKKDNDSKLLLTNISPIMDKKGKKFGFLLLAEDITHRNKEQVQRFLSQKLEALGQMAAGVAHEIRSPLQYIGDNGRFLKEAFGSLIALSLEIQNKIKEAEGSGAPIEAEALSQLLSDSDFDFFVEEIPKASEQIVDGVTRVSNIVKSMYEFSHTGDEVDEKSDLNKLLKSTLVVAQNRIKKVADLETEYAPDLPPIPCGMGELNQVFLNLLINAADAIAETGKRGLIKVSTKQKDDELIVKISDNGIGIPEKIKEKIFTPFFTTKDVGKGTGQGLHFSYRIVVERHKGKLYFESKVNEGTTFYIHLPIEGDLNGFSQEYFPSTKL